jgi:hypothetical protein
MSLGLEVQRGQQAVRPGRDPQALSQCLRVGARSVQLGDDVTVDDDGGAGWSGQRLGAGTRAATLMRFHALMVTAIAIT